MTNLIYIKKNNDLVPKKIVYNYLNPDYVYIPYKKDYELNVKTNDVVLKDSIILSKNNLYQYSPVSGKVLGLSEMLVNNKKTQVVVIENDFKEKVKKVKGVKKSLTEYSKEEVLDIIKLFSVYSGDLKGKMILVNGLDFEVYESNRSAIIKKFTNEILETIDALYTILDCEKCYFAIKNNDCDNVEGLIHHIGTYPYIDLKLMPDLYPLGHEDILKQELIMPRHEKLGIIYFSVEDIYNLYNVLKRQRPIGEKYITISGDLVVTPKILNVKIGSSLKDIILNNIKLKQDDYLVIINGLLSGYKSSLDLIITPEVNSVFLNTLSIENEKDCINCGMCHTKCPVGADPRTGYKIDKCIECGICTYICPAKINFKKGLKK